MVSSASVPPTLEVPFPGLRAFETQESLLFFGREAHTEELLRRLSERRFLAVVGSSGCGKSSLVRAGLLPALYRGYLVSATSRWRVAVLRPGTTPIDALAVALSKDGVLGPQDTTKFRETLGASSGGLVEAVRRAGLAPGESLLVVVDQFEELFRFAPNSLCGDSESQGSLFVSLLLRAVESEISIYVTLTMRSEYQGDCTQFPGLPEALNRSQYLVPRLTRDQRRQAIVRPLELFDAHATPRLVNRLLNDVGDDPDQLPVLQHALLQTYRRWRQRDSRGDIDLPDYEVTGGITHALGRHGDEILAGLTEDDPRLAEKIFRCLTAIERGRVIRRPKELDSIYGVVNATDELTRVRVSAIISTFARREHSLLVLSSPTLEHGTVVDITHESLMRKWPRLADWIREEALSAEWYSDLARDVVRHRTGDAGLWRDPELLKLLKRRDREGWNEAWALQYSRPNDPPFAEVEKFLDESGETQAEEHHREEAQRRNELERAEALAHSRRRVSITLSLLLVTIVVAAAVVYFLYQRNKDFAQKYLVLLSAQYKAQNTAEEARSQLDRTRSEFQKARNGTAEQARMLEQLNQNVKLTQGKVDDYEKKIKALRAGTADLSSDRTALLDRIQDLQAQLLRSNQTSASRDPDPAQLKRIDDLQTKLATTTIDRDNLRNDLQRAVMRKTFNVQQFSVVHLSPVPAAGSIAIGIGDIRVPTNSDLLVYIWTADPLPKIIPGDKKRSQQFLDPLECNAEGTGGRWCYRVKKLDTILGNQRPGRFVLGGVPYEILATGWYNKIDGRQDSISLTFYPATQAAK